MPKDFILYALFWRAFLCLNLNKKIIPEGQPSGILLFKGEVKKSQNHKITFFTLL